ncbi:unnamed protein product [Ceratitis capitata]|nr:unnamed protein product [Ceratitis capitata]
MDTVGGHSYSEQNSFGNFSTALTLHAEARMSTDVRLIGWNVPPEEMRHIPDHWLKYPEPPAHYHYILGTLYLIFTTVSMAGNGVVVYIFSA